MAIVFRCIRDDECPQFGLFARDISDDNDKHTAEAHVANGKSKTGWISATRSLAVALKNFIKYGNDPKAKQNYFNRIVIIDTDYLDEGYEDCANRTDWKQEKAIRFGREAQEIAIRGCVPPKAIETVLINDKDIEEFKKPVNEQDIALLKVISDAYNEGRSREGKINLAGTGCFSPALYKPEEYEPSDDKKDRLSAGRKQCDRYMTQIMKAIDFVSQKCLESGDMEMLRASFIALAKKADIIQRFWTQHLEDTRQKLHVSYTIPTVPYDREMRSPSLDEFAKYKTEAEKFFNSLYGNKLGRENTVKRYNSKQLDVGIVAVWGEYKGIRMLQEKYGGEIYDNGTKWIGPANIGSVNADIMEALMWEKELVEATKNAVFSPSPESNAEYEFRMGIYNQVFGIREKEHQKSPFRDNGR